MKSCFMNIDIRLFYFMSMRKSFTTKRYKLQNVTASSTVSKLPITTIFLVLSFLNLFATTIFLEWTIIKK